METQKTESPLTKDSGKESVRESSIIQVKAVLDGLNDAFKAKDLKQIMSYYSPDVVAYDVVKSLQYVGIDSYSKSWKEFLDMAGTMTCESRDLKIKADESLAFCYSLNHIQGVMKGGQKTDMWMRSTTCLNKVNGKWLIVHEHASEPVDFESGKILTNLSPDKPLLH